jgi:hypothetical protein
MRGKAIGITIVDIEILVRKATNSDSKGHT